MTVHLTPRMALLSCAVLLAGCEVGPDYHRPEPIAAPAPQYKELADWIKASPDDAAPKGDWWTDFHDPLLDQLEPLVQVNNQTVQADYQNYQAALAFVKEADADLFPVIGATGSVTRTRTNAGTVTTTGAGGGGAGGGATGVVGRGGQTVATQGITEGTLTWTPDIWGQIRREIEENEANAQADEAIYANAALSEQVALANALIDLRITDANIDLYEKTVKEYQENYRIISNAVEAGYSLYPPSDEMTAKVQLENAQASLINLGVARAQYAHAIAVLVGKNPEDLDIPHSEKLPNLPDVPVGVPSSLLQRRPDIASAERTMAAENAAVGVTIAAYYPNIPLSASFGVSQTPLGALFSAGNEVWSAGVSGTATLLDFGYRSADVAAAKATYQSSVATYRGTVLGAFQNVENDLAGLRILQQEAGRLDDAVRDAKRGAQIAFNEYQAGIVDYTTVATAQETELMDEQTALNVAQTRLNDAATLIGDLGGGWSADQLHDPQAGPSDHPIDPIGFVPADAVKDAISPRQ